MRFASLGSGSKGNGLLVEHRQTCLLVDCGFTLKDTTRRLARLGKTPTDLTAVLVTHEHGDHIRGVGALARKYNLPVYMTHGTSREWLGRDNGINRSVQLEYINSHQDFALGGITVRPVAVPHDAREPCQFTFHCDDKKLGLLTDLGSITPFVQQAYQGCHAVLLECNHDRGMLAEGPYPYSLKQRVGGDYGHLSNEQAAVLLKNIMGEQLQHVVLSHISETNNTAAYACNAIKPILQAQFEGLDDVLIVADQDSGFDWLAVSTTEALAV